MIRIIAGTYGYWNGHYVEPKTSKDSPFTLTSEQEKRLVNKGVAEYVTTFKVENEVVGYNDGDSIVVTDEDVIKEKLSELDEDVPITIESLLALKMPELREKAEEYGVDYKVGMKKTELAELTLKAIEVYETQNESEEDETPELPNPLDNIV